MATKGDKNGLRERGEGDVRLIDLQERQGNRSTITRIDSIKSRERNDVLRKGELFESEMRWKKEEERIKRQNEEAREKTKKLSINRKNLAARRKP